MSALVQILHVLAGLVVMAEALNKLERCAPFAAGLRARQRWAEALKALAWLLLALGAGGALAGPLLMASGFTPASVGSLLRMEHPTLDQALVLVGFAVLVVRTRVKEG